VNVRVALVLLVLLAGCGRGERVTATAAGPAPLALVGGRVQPAPGVPPVADAVVVIEHGIISAVGGRGDVRLPDGAVTLDCTGATVSAGFWNSHVHFTEPVWNDAATSPAERLAGGLRAMLTSYGFVHVFDTGSLPANTAALRRRIESGEIAGPSIRMASGSFVPPGGSPYYLRPMRLPELRTPADAERLVPQVVDAGADAVKLFTGSFAERGVIVVMPVDVVRAAVAAAHRRGKLVFAHPSNSAGARAALDGGVDILAHTFPTELDGPWDRALPVAMQERGMALIPTLKLWPYELGKVGLPAEVVRRVLGNGQAQVRAFADAGGQVLFGTDVGYMTEYDPTDEYVHLAEAGLSYAEILAALTTAPAARFGVARLTGRVVPGLAADLTVVDGEPERDIRALARVRYAVRAGRIVYSR
jgi:imidazolonepropionase-like amidohydrolase